MSIFVIGINYKTAPLSVREKVFFAGEKLPFYYQDLMSRGLTDAILLSTCNRSELYCETDQLNLMMDWFCGETLKVDHPISRQALESFLYIYQDEKAIAHIMQVACGLDSMVLGEPQILGQMKEAFSESCTAGAVSPLFHRLFQQVFASAKEIRTTTAIGACPVSLVSAATQFAKQKVSAFSEAKIALVGAGDTSLLLLRYLSDQVKKPITLINRSLEKAICMIEAFNGHAASLLDLPKVLSEADVVFSATGSVTPLITLTMMDEVMVLRKQKPIVMLDIAVPRNIAADVSKLAHVQVFTIDDLKKIIEDNRQGREHASQKALEMIWQKSRDFIQDLAAFDKVTHTITAYRKQVENICRVELQRAKHRLHQGMDPDVVLDTFAYAFTQKLLHEPSVKLRQAGLEGRFELLSFAKQLFAIQDLE